jgi:heme/copper-type cytochrome/quinol oxidase subunit 4
MHPALKGLLIGFALGIGLWIFEYMSMNKNAAVRAKKMAQKKALNQDEQVRVRNMLTFGLFIIPPLTAGIFWLMDW